MAILCVGCQAYSDVLAKTLKMFIQECLGKSHHVVGRFKLKDWHKKFSCGQFVVEPLQCVKLNFLEPSVTPLKASVPAKLTTSPRRRREGERPCRPAGDESQPASERVHGFRERQRADARSRRPHAARQQVGTVSDVRTGVSRACRSNSTDRRRAALLVKVARFYLICLLGRIANARRHAASIRGRSRWHSATFASSCTGFPPCSNAPHHRFIGPKNATEHAVAMKAYVERQHRCSSLPSSKAPERPHQRRS
jgi:hypothetical protein